MKLSIVIPYMETDPEKHKVLERLLDSIKGLTDEDEIIVIENDRAGYAVPINYGLSEAKGDFMLVLNDDLVMNRGEDIHSICDVNFVTSPCIDEREQSLWGCAFCIPRWVYAKVGGLDERYRVSYFDDDDYINILREHNVPMKCMPFVNFINVDGGGRTLHTFPDYKEFFEENRQRFVEKWGGTPQQIDMFYQQKNRLPREGEII
jgi:glycosyltransferase involved in cell wall biosynthesis